MDTETNATEETAENENTTAETTETAQTEGNNGTVDADKVVEKLQKRIGKEQAAKNDVQDKLDAALEQIEQLKKGKTVQKLSAEEKAKQAEAEKDKRIAELEDAIKISKTTQQTDAVLKDAGLIVPANLLATIVSTDDDKTFAGAKALIEFANGVRESARKELLKGSTPRQNGQQQKTVSREQFDSMDVLAKMQFGKDNPEQYKKLLGE